MMRRSPSILVALLLAVASVLFMSGAVSAAAMPVTVEVFDFDYSPDPATITVGDTVTWNDPAGGARHDAVSVEAGGPISSGPPRNTGWTYSVTFNTPGTYNYICTLHGDPADPSSMYGTVIVQSSTAVTLSDLGTASGGTGFALAALGLSSLGLVILAGRRIRKA